MLVAPARTLTLFTEMCPLQRQVFNSDVIIMLGRRQLCHKEGTGACMGQNEEQMFHRLLLS